MAAFRPGFRLLIAHDRLRTLIAIKGVKYHQVRVGIGGGAFVKLRLGMWMRGAIVASVLWMLVGGWLSYRTAIWNAERAWVGRAERCQDGAQAFATCSNDALAVLNSQIHDAWKIALGVAFVRLCVAWLLGLIAVYGIRWALAGRRVSETNGLKLTNRFPPK